MRRRDFISMLGALMSLGTPAFAQSTEDRVVRRLQQDGYRSVTVRRTLLGRVRIVGTGPAGRREIVLNPATGAILRDYEDRSDRDDDDRSSGSGRGGGNSGSGRDDDDDDDDRDDDDDDRDDDDDDSDDDDRDDDDRDDDDGDDGDDDDGDDDD